MFPFLKCKQDNLIAEETTDFLLREREEWKGESYVPIQILLAPQSDFTNPLETLHRPPAHTPLSSPSPRTQGLPGLLVTFYVAKSQTHRFPIIILILQCSGFSLMPSLECLLSNIRQLEENYNSHVLHPWSTILVSGNILLFLSQDLLLPPSSSNSA